MEEFTVRAQADIVILAELTLGELAVVHMLWTSLAHLYT